WTPKNSRYSWYSARESGYSSAMRTSGRAGCGGFEKSGLGQRRPGRSRRHERPPGPPCFARSIGLIRVRSDSTDGRVEVILETRHNGCANRPGITKFGVFYEVVIEASSLAARLCAPSQGDRA